MDETRTTKEEQQGIEENEHNKTSDTHLAKDNPLMPQQIHEIDSIQHDGESDEGQDETGIIDGAYQCNLCQKTFPDRRNLGRHMKLSRHFEVFKCNTCDEEFANSGKLYRHRQTHSDSRHDCEVCGKSFLYSGGLKRHMLIHLGIKNHKCEVCNKEFTQACALKQHMVVHTGLKAFKCDDCSKRFTTRESVQQHVLSQHEGIRPYTCEMCHKKFCTASNLRAHMFVHSSEKRFKCSKCDKAFRSSSNLRKHELRHLDIRKYECDVCNKKFTQSSALKQHSMLHSDDKPHQCEVCQKPFSHLAYLRKHMIKHANKSNRVKETCYICMKEFVTPKYLEAHIKRKHGSGKKKRIKLKCFVCPKEFITPTYLTIHMEKYHKNVEFDVTTLPKQEIGSDDAAQTSDESQNSTHEYTYQNSASYETSFDMSLLRAQDKSGRTVKNSLDLYSSESNVNHVSNTSNDKKESTIQESPRQSSKSWSVSFVSSPMKIEPGNVNDIESHKQAQVEPYYSASVGSLSQTSVNINTKDTLGSFESAPVKAEPLPDGEIE